MPFFGSIEGNFGYGRGVTTSSSPILPGNATTNMNITGATQVTGVAGIDDAWGQIPTDTSFTFNFFGSNHGGNSNLGINWNTNNVLMFGSQTNTIQWGANTGRGILTGNFDRRCTTAYYFPISTIGTYKVLITKISFQNIYNSGSANEGQFQMRLAKDSVTGNQYIEWRIFKGSGGANSGAITSAGYGSLPGQNGGWNITNGTTFQNTFSNTFATAFPADNRSFVLSSDPNGSNWTFSNTSYLNL